MSDFDLPPNAEIQRDSINADLREFAETFERETHEDREYYKLMNIGLYEIKQRITASGLANIILLSLILWRVW